MIPCSKSTCMNWRYNAGFVAPVGGSRLNRYANEMRKLVEKKREKKKPLYDHGVHPIAPRILRE